MAIKQIIKYNSENKYFAGFLNYIKNEVKIEGSVTFNKDEIILILDDSDAKKLELFSKITSKYLPHSIFLGHIQTLRTDEIVYSKPFTSPSYNIALCLRCLEDLTRPSSNRYLDDTIRCNHYSNEEMKENQDLTLYSPHYSKCCTLLLCKASKVDDLFIITDNEKKILFSIEKPTIKVTIKEQSLKEMTGKTYINVKSPHNVKGSLAALNAEDSEIDYLFFEDINESKIINIQENTSYIRDTRITSKLSDYSDDKVVNRFLNIANEMGNKNNAIGAYISVSNGISFMVSNDEGAQKVLSFQDFNVKKLFIDMKNDENKSKLLNNFIKKYDNTITLLEANENYSIFEALSVILELKEHSFEAVSDKSLEFRGNGGLKIDMNFDEYGFDFVSFFGSIMSFKLAATDDHYLAYSIFEAFGDMSIASMNQLKTKLDIENFIIMGDMFENSILYSRILSKFNTSNPYFSKYYALDA